MASTSERPNKILASDPAPTTSLAHTISVASSVRVHSLGGQSRATSQERNQIAPLGLDVCA